jgi:hypothetical protein
MRLGHPAFIRVKHINSRAKMMILNRLMPKTRAGACKQETPLFPGFNKLDDIAAGVINAH